MSKCIRLSEEEIFKIVEKFKGDGKCCTAHCEGDGLLYGLGDFYYFSVAYLMNSDICYAIINKRDTFHIDPSDGSKLKSMLDESREFCDDRVKALKSWINS